MPHPLIATKLYLPRPRPNFVPRPRLINRLNHDLWTEEGAFTRRVTLVAAPAGYGKTVLVADWLSNLDTRIAWFSIEEDDNDPTRFLIYLIAALQQVDPGIGQTAQALLQAPTLPPQEMILTTLVNEAAAFTSPFALALDDYHLIQTTAIHQQLTFLVEHLPSQWHLVIMAREDPPLPISRLQAREEILVLRQDDLRFTTSEALAFFQKLVWVDLPPQDVASLTHRTEGWATGLQLAALSMQGVQDRHQFVQSFTGSNRFILDYLFEEVFDQLSPGKQAFLLKTSILNRFCGPLCDALTEQSKSQELIQSLEQANLFIVPLDNSREWYRYHRLFNDLLRHRLSITHPTLENTLHRRASQWFAQNGLQAEAIQHSLLAQDWGQAIPLILEVNEDMLKRGEITTLLGWLQQLPQDLLRKQPDLCLLHSWALALTGQSKAALSLLVWVEEQAKDDPQLLGEIATLQAYIARTQGDTTGTIEQSQRALSLLPETERDGRTILAFNLGITYWHIGELAKAESAMLQALRYANETGNHYVALSARIFIGRTFASQGQLRQAMEAFQNTIEAETPVPTAALAHLDLCALYYEWNDLTAAMGHLHQALEISRRTWTLEFQIACYIQLALIHLGLGDIHAASEAMQESHQFKDEDIPRSTQDRRSSCHVQLALAQEDLPAAKRWLRQVSGPHDAHPFYRFLDLNEARIRMAEGQRAAAREILASAYELASTAEWKYGLLATRVLQALAEDDPEVALEFLVEALLQAQSERFIRLFVDAGEIIVSLLQKAVERGVSPEYVGQILSVLGGKSRIPSASPLIEPLSEREAEVLRLLIAGLSNREMAKQLILSLGTVKTHIHNIYGKLEVHNRAQAVMRAKELNLV